MNIKPTIKETSTMRPPFTHYANWIAVLQILCFCGCESPTVLRFDHDEYSKVYAAANNKQLLLNLARLSNHEPVYFIQLGSISSQYQITSSVGASSTYTFSHGPATLGGTLNAGFTQTPIFQFVPLTGTNFVQAILTPISEKVFMTLYDQGYRADLVVRTMVSSVEHKDPDGTHSEFWVNDPRDPTYYKFLVFCANLRNAQLSHDLILDSANVTSVVVYASAKAKLPDAVTTVQTPGFSVTCETNSGTVTVTYKEKALQWKNKPMIPQYPFFTNIHELTRPSLATTPSLEFTYDKRPKKEKRAAASTLANSVLQTNIVLKMRTFEAAMYSVARQQAYFEELDGTTRGNIEFSHDDFGPFARLRDDDIKVRPVMTLKYASIKQRPGRTLVELKHDDEIYSVTDFTGTGEIENLAVFTMLSYLYAQTSISTQSLPVQQTIRLQ